MRISTVFVVAAGLGLSVSAYPAGAMGSGMGGGMGGGVGGGMGGGYGGGMGGATGGGYGGGMSGGDYGGRQAAPPAPRQAPGANRGDSDQGPGGAQSPDTRDTQDRGTPHGAGPTDRNDSGR